MASASVKLIKGSSYHVGKYTFILNQPQTLTDEQEIQRFTGRSNFTVTRHSPPPGEKEPPSGEKEPPSGEKESGEKSNLLSEDKLKSMKKTKLIKLGAKHGLFFEGTELKKDMIADIMEAQDE